MTAPPVDDQGSAGPDASHGRWGRRRFLGGAGAIAGAGMLGAALPGGPVRAAPPGASSFGALPAAVRIVDTRDAGSYDFARLDPNHLRVTIAGRNLVPPGATAAVLTLTGVNYGEGNFVTAFPTGLPRPEVSNLNMAPGEATANLVTVRLGPDGSIDLFHLRPAELVVDVLGYYAPVSGPVRAGRFVGLPSAVRAVDTRPALVGGASFTTVDLTWIVPPDASAVQVNLTATETTGPGFFTAVPDDQVDPPTTSSLNVSSAWATRAAGVIVPVRTIGGQRRIKVYTLTPAKLIVDVGGYFTGPTSPLSEDGLFVPVDPVRLVDTRWPGAIGRMWPNWVVEGQLPASIAGAAGAIVGNVTGVDSRSAGFLTVSAARQPLPPTSNVNWTTAGAVVPNHVVTPVTATFGFQVFSSHGAHVVFDLFGYFTGSPGAAALPPWVNPPPPPAQPPWILQVPRIGLLSYVFEGDPTSITNSGHSWHWTGTGWMGQDAHVGLFAHRTDAGGPYRYIHRLQVGDTWTVTTGDRREYTYRMVRRDLTNSAVGNILDATRLHPGTTTSLIACTVGYDRTKSAYPDIWAPTSLKYRIVVTGELVSWREV